MDAYGQDGQNRKTNNDSKWQLLASLTCHHGGGGCSPALCLQNLAGLETMHLKKTKIATSILTVKQLYFCDCKLCKMILSSNYLFPHVCTLQYVS